MRRPRVIAAALAACTRRVKNGIAVQVLPLSHPHPPIRIAATTPETYLLVEQLGRPVFVAVRGLAHGIPDALLVDESRRRIPNERVLKSMRLFAERVAPRLA